MEQNVFSESKEGEDSLQWMCCAFQVRRSEVLVNTESAMADFPRVQENKKKVCIKPKGVGVVYFEVCDSHSTGKKEAQ